MKEKELSLRELDEIGEELARDYSRGRESMNADCFDIEGFTREYLGLDIRDEWIAEDDPDVIGFLADGEDRLTVLRNGEPESVVFPKGTVVLDRSLLRRGQSGRRRFTMAHEAAHEVLGRLYQRQGSGRCRRNLSMYEGHDQAERRDYGEVQADRLGAAYMMSRSRLENNLKKYHGGMPVLCYGSGVIPLQEKRDIQKMADAMGVSYTALLIQLKEQGMVEHRSIEEFSREYIIGRRECR